MKNSKIYISGHNGMVGSATLKIFEEVGYNKIITASRKELDLTKQTDVFDFFERERPDVVILAAAKVGGIQANIDNPATFLLDNLQIQNNLISASHKFGVKKFVFLGSSCIYPKECQQPMKEEMLMTGKLEPTNEGYALAKIAGLKLLEGMYRQFGMQSISLMPCNLYGPNDSFDLNHSHVLSALVKRLTDAKDLGIKEIELWGSGKARREFMHVEDCAKAIQYMLENYSDPKFINIGWGEDVSIKELAELILEELDYDILIKWNTNKPDGMLRKCLDVTRMKELGFYPSITLRNGVKEMIDLYEKFKKV
jgi:GDP-L-fucose synthase